MWNRELGDRLSIIRSKRYIKKVALVGDSAVGKTSLIRRFVVDVFDDKYVATIGAKVSKKDIEYKLLDKTVYLTLMIWDILGQKDYRKTRIQGLDGAHGVILVSDLSRLETIRSADEFWLPEVFGLCPTAPVIMVGNKNDIAVPGGPEMLISASAEATLPMLLCSAKTGENVQQCFERMGESVLAGELAGQVPSEETTAESLASAVDDVVSDFCEQYGDTPKAMEIVEKEFARAEVDVNAPSKEALLMAVEYLSDVERDIHGRDVSEVNKLRRWKMIDETR